MYIVYLDVAKPDLLLAIRNIIQLTHLFSASSSLMSADSRSAGPPSCPSDRSDLSR